MSTLFLCPKSLTRLHLNVTTYITIFSQNLSEIKCYLTTLFFYIDLRNTWPNTIEWNSEEQRLSLYH